VAKRERQSNIELLRILAIIGVIVLHYNNPGVGGGMTYAQRGSVNYYVLYTLQAIFDCGVNLFILISGYFLCRTKKVSLWKAIELTVQVMLFGEGIYIAQVIAKQSAFSVKTAVTSMIPTNYFLILYCAVYILAPFTNALIERLNDRNLKTFVVVSIVLFSVYPTLVDVLGEIEGEEIIGLSTIGKYGSQWGYSLVNFLLMYLIGAYLSRSEGGIKAWKTGTLLGVFALSVAVIVGWSMFNVKIGCFREPSAWEYCNPVIILIAVVVFILFTRINLGSNKVINKLAAGTFSVFLLHSVLLKQIPIEKFVKGNVFVMLLHIAGCAIGLYLACWCVHMVYHLITDPIFAKLSSKHKLIIHVDEPVAETDGQ